MNKSSIRAIHGIAGVAFFLACVPMATAGAGPAPLRGSATDPIEGPVTSEEYARRRAAIAAEMEADGVFIVFGTTAAEQGRQPAAQDAHFRYLTGIVEPDAGLIIEKSGGRISEILFVQPRNPSREIWEGSRLGAEGASALTGIPALSNERMLVVVDSLVARHSTLYTLTPLLPGGLRAQTLSREQQHLRSAIEAGGDTRVVSLVEPLRRLRARKSATELDMIRRAVHISALAHREAIRSVEPGMNEFEIHGLIEYTFRRNGADGPAFASIVGSGPNAATLHYRTADRFMADGELLLMDIGASYRGYAADVTRTIPVGGRFTDEQRALYEIVLDAQRAAEDAVELGGVWTPVNRAATDVLAEGLARLGLIDSPDATYFCASPQSDDRCPQHRLYYMHAVGHGVGLEVHDPDISSFESFEVGSVFTLEPGLYIRGDALDFLRDSPDNREMIARLSPNIDRYRDLGVRIEDVYILTENGLERVSDEAPREIAEIEAMRMEQGTGSANRQAEVVEWYRATSGR